MEGEGRAIARARGRAIGRARWRERGWEKERMGEREHGR